MEQIEASSDGMIDDNVAAMMITNFHHKATAALANNPEDQLDETSTPYSPDHTTMFDTSVPFMAGMSGSIPINQMPWDHFMSNSVIEPKASSVSSSSLSGSQDSQLSQLSFNSASTVQPHPNQLPPMMERYPRPGTPVPHRLHAHLRPRDPQRPLTLPLYDRTSLACRLSTLARPKSTHHHAQSTATSIRRRLHHDARKYEAMRYRADDPTQL